MNDNEKKFLENCKIKIFKYCIVKYLIESDLKVNLLLFKDVNDGKAITTEDTIKKCLSRFELDDRKVYIVTDNASNMVAAFKNYCWVGCSTHQLNTILTR